MNEAIAIAGAVIGIISGLIIGIGFGFILFDIFAEQLLSWWQLLIVVIGVILLIVGIILIVFGFRNKSKTVKVE